MKIEIKVEKDDIGLPMDIDSILIDCFLGYCKTDLIIDAIFPGDKKMKIVQVPGWLLKELHMRKLGLCKKESNQINLLDQIKTARS